MASVTINIKESNPVDIALATQALEEIARNYTRENLQKIAKVSRAKDVNTKLPTLLNNPIVKMHL
ncbi:MAG: hypothetical protein KF900_13980 [Bacteroidetes bacterium]|nr:hypothetical protein [Bacteroidota bacterium]